MSFTTHSQSRKILGKQQLIRIINVRQLLLDFTHDTLSFEVLPLPNCLKSAWGKKCRKSTKKIFDFYSDQGLGADTAS